MENLIDRLYGREFVLNFLKSPKKENPFSRAYYLHNQYQAFKEGLEEIFCENPEILPEFPLVFGMVKREMFPADSLREYSALTDRGVIEEFKRQKGGDSRKGIAQGYLVAGTVEKYLQEELLRHLSLAKSNFVSGNTSRGSHLGGIPCHRDFLWEAICIADKLKPVILGSLAESYMNRVREIDQRTI